MLKSIAIFPPLGFARVGASKVPCSAFCWSSVTLSPDQPATTALKPEETLILDDEGNVSVSVPNEIVLKDEDGNYRPVCPFFELWGVWEEEGADVEGPITLEVLKRFDLDLDKVVWSVDLGNLKPYHITLNDSDRITAHLDLKGDDTAKTQLFGKSPKSKAAVVKHPDGIPMGEVQLAKPSEEFPELRLRFYAPAGVVYGPPNIEERVRDAIAADPDSDRARAAKRWLELDLPTDRQRVNPASSWANHDFEKTPVPPVGAGDTRVNPNSLVASIGDTSIGLVDDVGDGLITCSVGGLTAHARISVGPADFAPMNRPMVSLQDGLSDRAIRDSARDGSISEDELEAIVADIFERALETSDLMNKDAQNNRAFLTNRGEYRDGTGNPLVLPYPASDFESNPHGTLWPTINGMPAANSGPVAPQSVDAMPVTFLGQRKHRRYNAIEYLRDRLKEEPELIEKWLRPPRPTDVYYDRRMPALIRGSDRHAMHLTRRQYELIQRWAKRQSGLS